MAAASWVSRFRTCSAYRSERTYTAGRVDWFSTDPNRPGVFAFGQEACGIFAFGQFATGVIAIGQFARGVIAIGQVAVGVVAIGQAALGVLYGGGMIALVGRGFGFALKVLPGIRVERFQRPDLPPLSSPAALRSAEVTQGWVLARLEDGRLRVDGEPLELEEEAELAQQLRQGASSGHTHACVTIEAEDRAQAPQGGYREAAGRELVLIGKRMRSWREAPPRVHLEGPLTRPFGLLVRAIAMVALVYAWCIVAGSDVITMVIGK